MAGEAGTVRNTSPFASFVITKWQDWMTRAVIEHAAGAPIPLLRERYGRSGEYLSNVMRTAQASDIIRTMNKRALAATHDTVLDKMKAANIKALDRVNQFLDDDELAQKAPATVWQLSLKTMDTMKLPDTAPLQQFNQQNNYYLSPEILSKLKSEAQHGLIAPPQEVQYNYESPIAPAGATQSAILRSRVRELTNPGKDGPSVPLQLRLEPADEV